MLLLQLHANFIVFQTGASKGYAFIEFADEEVAKIAASATNNYLMFHKLLKC